MEIVPINHVETSNADDLYIDDDLNVNLNALEKIDDPYRNTKNGFKNIQKTTMGIESMKNVYENIGSMNNVQLREEIHHGYCSEKYQNTQSKGNEYSVPNIESMKNGYPNIEHFENQYQNIENRDSEYQSIQPPENRIQNKEHRENEPQNELGNNIICYKHTIKYRL